MSGRSYVTNFQHYVAPFPNWHVLVPNIRYFQAHGVLGIFEEGTYATSGGDLVEPLSGDLFRAYFVREHGSCQSFCSATLGEGIACTSACDVRNSVSRILLPSPATLINC